MSKRKNNPGDFNPRISSNHQPSGHSTPALFIVIVVVGILLVLYSLVT